MVMPEDVAEREAVGYDASDGFPRGGDPKCTAPLGKLDQGGLWAAPCALTGRRGDSSDNLAAAVAR